MSPGGFKGDFESFQQDVHPEDRDRVFQAIRSAVEGGGDYHVEYRLRPKETGVIWVEGKGRVLYDPSGRPVRMIGVCMDVTARKQAEATLSSSLTSEHAAAHSPADRTP